jgi:hypothetical protein
MAAASFIPGAQFLPGGALGGLGLTKTAAMTGLGALTGSGVLRPGKSFNLQGALIGGAAAYGSSKLADYLAAAGGAPTDTGALAQQGGSYTLPGGPELLNTAEPLVQLSGPTSNPQLLQLENLTNLIYKKKLKGVSQVTPVGNIPLKISDGSVGNAEVIIDPNSSEMGYIDNASEDKLDPKKFIIYINPNRISSKKLIFQSLYHEYMHVTDPVFSTKFSEKLWATYDSSIDEKYWAHPIEFRATANEFLPSAKRPAIEK